MDIHGHSSACADHIDKRQFSSFRITVPGKNVMQRAKTCGRQAYEVLRESKENVYHSQWQLEMYSRSSWQWSEPLKNFAVLVSDITSTRSATSQTRLNSLARWWKRAEILIWYKRPLKHLSHNPVHQVYIDNKKTHLSNIRKRLKNRLMLGACTNTTRNNASA